MLNPWYKIARECVSIRKNVLRADMCVFIDDEKAFANTSFLNSTIKSILTSAIIKGLDIVGILTNSSPSVGIKAQKMAIRITSLKKSCGFDPVTIKHNNITEALCAKTK